VSISYPASFLMPELFSSTITLTAKSCHPSWFGRGAIH